MCLETEVVALCAVHRLELCLKRLRSVTRTTGRGGGRRRGGKGGVGVVLSLSELMRTGRFDLSLFVDSSCKLFFFFFFFFFLFLLFCFVSSSSSSSSSAFLLLCFLFLFLFLFYFLFLFLFLFFFIFFFCCCSHCRHTQFFFPLLFLCEIPNCMIMFSS